MDRLPGFVGARRRNFDFLRERLSVLEEFLILPAATPGSRPSWFGLPLTLKESAGANRVDLLRYLEQHRIGTRLLFAGNLTRQPYFAGKAYRRVGELPNTDRVMRDTFWVGVYPGLAEDQLIFTSQKIAEFFGHGW
ncbi:MAG: DegT/DnrJ/EryC1/StrS family aminotransferase [Gallionellaceae bacterium]|nr:DegT/DnrJ/EryC1/StrS family aminotransferase [Gallionellaceae bacterium]